MTTSRRTPEIDDLSISDLDLSDLDIALAEVEAEEIEARAADGETQPEAVVEEPAPVPGEALAEDLSDLVSELAIEEVKAEAYADAEAKAEAEGALTPPATEAPTAEPTSAPSTKAPRAARAVKSLNDLPASAFVLLKEDDRDPETIRRDTMGRLPSAKKVREKFENALTQLAVGKTPSVYVTYAWQLLRAKGEMTSADLVACLSARGYKLGTARAQAQQVMTLLPALMMVNQDGKKLVINPKSRLAEVMNGLPAATGAGA